MKKLKGEYLFLQTTKIHLLESRKMLWLTILIIVVSRVNHITQKPTTTIDDLLHS